MAPSYAELFLKYLEKDLLELYNNNKTKTLAEIYRWYIMIWPHGEEELKK